MVLLLQPVEGPTSVTTTSQGPDNQPPARQVNGLKLVKLVLLLVAPINSTTSINSNVTICSNNATTSIYTTNAVVLAYGPLRALSPKPLQVHLSANQAAMLLAKLAAGLQHQLQARLRWPGPSGRYVFVHTNTYYS